MVGSPSKVKVNVGDGVDGVPRAGLSGQRSRPANRSCLNLRLAKISKEFLDSCRYVPCRDNRQRRAGMNRGLRRSAVLLFGLMVIFQFNNCGVYEANVNDANSVVPDLDVCESQTECVVKTNANLKIQPLPVDNFPVPASLIAFNIGGDCNEAGFSTQRITWSLKYNNTVVRTSNMLIDGKSWNAECVNGKFRLYVNLKSIGQDPVDRTGLKFGASTARAAYVLDVEMLAQDASGAWLRNINHGGFKQVHLVPLN